MTYYIKNNITNLLIKKDMLKNSEEIELLSSAQEPGIRDPLRSEWGPKEILCDFFKNLNISGQRVLELGPGHYEFCEIIRERGAIAEAVELDPPVIELGLRRKFRVWPGNLTQLPSLRITGKFDGLFCKGSNNPFWFYGDEEKLRTYIGAMVHLVKPNGWLWIVSSPDCKPILTSTQVIQWLEIEAKIYRELGFTEWVVPHKAIASYYGICFTHPRLAVFTLGLPPHSWSLYTIVRLIWFCVKAFVRSQLRKLQK
jgi:hypothetical protein